MTAATAPRQPAEPEPAIVNSALERIAEATNFFEFEQAWIHGLRQLSASDGSDCRALLLAEAGRRLSVFDDIKYDIARRHWLDQVVAEVRLRGDSPLERGLAVVATNELREAFAHAHPAITDLLAAVNSGESLHEFAIRCPLAADHVRDLGRIAEGLSGSGLLALCSLDNCELARSLARAMKPPLHLVPTVPESLRVTRDDLLQWAQTSGAATAFPRLVRSLIAETEPSAESVHMPAGTGVASPGWDGVVRCARGNRFVPVGTSVWELTTQQSSTHAKAVEDYTKRVKDSTPDQRCEIAYVSAACAPWTKAQAFESQYSDEGDFSRVSALNVDNLEDWLSCAIATTVWMREQIGKPTVGIGLLARWWENWLAATTPPLDERFVLAGREQTTTDLRDRCKQGPGVVTIGGQIHRDEIIAFVAAALVTADAEGLDVGHVLFVDNHVTAKWLFAQEAMSMPPSRQTAGPVLTMMVPSKDFATHLPAGSPHRMIVPIPGSIQTEIVLDSVDSGEISKHFEDAGVELHTAYRRGGLARMSLMALRRHLSVKPALHMPDWAKRTPDRTIRRSLLLGGWNAAREGDREIVSRFTCQSHEDVAEDLRKLDPGDSPMTSTGELWHAVSPADTWMLMRAHLSPSDLQEFAEIAVEVLTASDPLREMSHEEALRAQIEGIKAKFSSQLKHGIATTLALAGSKPPTPHGETTPDSNFAERTTRLLLKSAMEDPTASTWIAVTDTLPLLAEAAPEAVLESLRTCIAEQHAFSEAMFNDHDDHFFDSSGLSPHLRILNALEVIAWSPDHLLAATDVLARLASIDPGGRYSNRPDATLASVMCPWMPYTSADAEVRLKAVQMLRQSHSSVAWPLMLSMLPRHHSVQTPGALPQYRDWRPSQRDVTLSERVAPDERTQTTTEIAAMLIDDVGGDPERWTDLIGRVGDLPVEARRSAVSVLGDLASAGADEAFRSRVWPVLKVFVARHRQFRDVKWALPSADLLLFEQIMDDLRPAEPSISSGELFSNSSFHLDGVWAADGYEEFQKALLPRQTEAVDAVMSSGGFKALFEFAAAVDNPRQVGRALARCRPGLDEQVLTAMDSAHEAVTQVALGYFGHRFVTLEWAGVEQLLEEHDLSPQVIADVLRGPPPVASPWTRVDARGADVAAEYWSRVSFDDLGIPDELDRLLDVCYRLLEAGRLRLARTLLTVRTNEYASYPEFADTVAALLEHWIEHPGDEIDQDDMAVWEFASLFRVLDEQRDHLGTARVAALEWQYLPLLQNDPEFSSPNLYREMLQDLDLFVQLVEIAFMPASAALDERPTLTTAQQQMTLSAWEVLRNWPASQFSPGVDEEGKLDEASLDKWVAGAQERFQEVDRADIGDEMIGTALSTSPADSSGDWPSEAVRNLLERLQSDDVERGFCITLRNQRGVTTRSPTDGGNQERQLADSYKEQSRRYQQWPRTAAIFSQLAKHYGHEASIHDRQAETFRRGVPR